MAKKEVLCGGRAFALSYEIVDNGANRWVLFLHGWGSNKEGLSGAFSRLFRGYNHLYLDLPGFGNSTNDFVLDSGDYAEVVRAFLEALNIAPVLVVGHSFGGKIATLLKPQILVLLSSAGLPKPKSLRIRAKILAAKVLKFCGVKTAIFRTKDAQKLPQNMYETLKRVVDEDLSAEFRARGQPQSQSEEFQAPIKKSRFLIFKKWLVFLPCRFGVLFSQRKSRPFLSLPRPLDQKKAAAFFEGEPRQPASSKNREPHAAAKDSRDFYTRVAREKGEKGKENEKCKNFLSAQQNNPPTIPPLQTFIFWGEDDRILPLFLGKKIHCIIHGSSLHCLAGDHFFYLKNATEIDRIVNAN